ncbi:MAG: glycosyltransferase, partial [Acidithiobacillus sp.]
MRVAVSAPDGPLSFRRYAQALQLALADLGIVCEEGGAPDATLFWNPYGGWGEPPHHDSKDRPFVLTFHGGAGWSKPLSEVYGAEPHPDSCRHAQQQRLRWEPVLADAAAILVPSQYGKEELLGLFALDPERIVVTPLGVDRAVFHSSQGDAVGSAGFLHVSGGGPVKRVGWIIEAYRALRRPDIPLTLVLPETRWPERPPPGVVLLAALNDDLQLAALYRRAIALIQVSAWETFALPVLEAAACGTPAILSRRAALLELWQDAAYFIPEDSPVGIHRAMEALLDPDTRNALAAKAFLRAQQYP